MHPVTGNMGPPLVAGVVWYAIGRFYEALDGTVQDVGYFAHLGGVEGPLFNGPPGEATAFFTFRAEPFTPQHLTNGDLTVALDPVGRFTLYFNPEPRGDFSAPESFAVGQPIATLQRLSTVVGTAVGPLSSNLFSAVLCSSEDFVFRGRTWNLGRFLPRGITQLGTGSTAALQPTPEGYRSVTAFVGSAMALGGEVRAP
ncbi:hypothetical protein [Corallococcus sp. AS-1-12]|uniref:hypothetical protein n=1 Tax=Corallococcus sp. AS-1-12 TaxID=2874598 RepID=UPI001CBFF324|nr:hypothetical protein [Corallococcus sp. AS-1-12]MBZ4333381.1 hypothetical protein [Corallococcus sp. AS-1-12]